MAALFGPLGAVNASLVGAPDYGSAPNYGVAVGATGTAQPPQQAVRRRGLFGGPIYPAPPVRLEDTGAEPLQPASPAVTGVQATRPDRYFGPFSRIGAGLGAGQMPRL